MLSYTSTLMVGSPLLSNLYVWLLGFLSNKLTRGEARHQGPRRFRQGSLEPVHDGSANTIFQGQAMHIPVEAPDLGAPVAEAPAPINPTVGMV